MNEKMSGDANKFLSPRERQVVALLVEGLNFKQIASRLKISGDIVARHVVNIRQKRDSLDRT